MRRKILNDIKGDQEEPDDVRIVEEEKTTLVNRKKKSGTIELNIGWIFAVVLGLILIGVVLFFAWRSEFFSGGGSKKEYISDVRIEANEIPDKYFSGVSDVWGKFSERIRLGEIKNYKQAREFLDLNLKNALVNSYSIHQGQMDMYIKQKKDSKGKLDATIEWSDAEREQIARFADSAQEGFGRRFK